MARSDAMSDRYRPEGTVWLETPFHASVHEVLLSVSRNASVKYRAPDCCAVSVMVPGSQVSKYGAKTCAGNGVGAAAAGDAPPTMTVRPVAVATATAAKRPRSVDRDMAPRF